LTDLTHHKSHQQFIKQHLNRRPLKPVALKYPCVDQRKYRVLPSLPCNSNQGSDFVPLGKVIIEALAEIAGRLRAQKLRQRPLKHVQESQGGRK